MNSFIRNVFRGLIFLLYCGCLWAADSPQVQALKDEKALLEAQAARDTAAALALKAANDLAKAKAATADIASEIQKSQHDTAAALTKAQIAAQNAQLDALKTTFGAPPTVGSDGNITITDASTGTLLQVKAGSLQVTWLLAEQLCKSLAASGVRQAFIAPAELDTKIQSARMVLREYYALVEKVKDNANKKLVGLDGVQAQAAPAAILGAVSLLQYGAGALQTISRLFRSDYAVGLSSDATRAAWLEYFMVAQCPDQIPQAQIEAAVKRQSIDGVLSELNGLMDFYNAATSKKAAIQKQIDLLTARITTLKADKQDTSALQGQLDIQQRSMLEIIPLDAWLPRIQALITTVSTTPGTFLEALTWYAFGDDKNPLKINERPRLTTVLTTQDGQITKTFWLTGKRVYGRSAGELIYRVVNPDGTVVKVGYLTALSSTGEIDFDSQGTNVTSETQRSRITRPAGKP